MEGEAVTVGVGPTTITAGPSSIARYPRVRTCDGHKVVLGIRAEDLHPAGDRPGFPTFNARIDLVEALGSGLMAYFTIDAVPVRTQAHVDMEAEVAGNGDSDSVVAAARPNLIAHYPPRVALRIGDSVPVAVDPDNLHFFDAGDGCGHFARLGRGVVVTIGVLAFAGVPLAAGAGARDAAPPTGPALEQLSRAARVLVLRVAADLLRHAGPVRERGPVQRPRRHDAGRGR